MQVEADEKELKAAGAEPLPSGRKGLRICGWEIESRKRSILTSSNFLLCEEKLQTSHLPEIRICCQLAEDVMGIETAEEVDELRAAKDVDSRTAVDVEGLKPVKNDVDLNISKDFEDLKSKLNKMDSKLREAGRILVGVLVSLAGLKFKHSLNRRKIAPTILLDVSRDPVIMNEIFGPLLPIVTENFTQINCTSQSIRYNNPHY